jgi:hypothetical protein
MDKRLNVRLAYDVVAALAEWGQRDCAPNTRGQKERNAMLLHCLQK